MLFLSNWPSFPPFHFSLFLFRNSEDATGISTTLYNTVTNYLRSTFVKVNNCQRGDIVQLCRLRYAVVLFRVLITERTVSTRRRTFTAAYRALRRFLKLRKTETTPTLDRIGTSDATEACMMHSTLQYNLGP